MRKEVTCILTSCGRFDLLRITLESFFKHNTYDIAEFLIYEDSGLPVPQDLKDGYPFIIWDTVTKRTGQITALDHLWEYVDTPYAFTMEDDWEFLRPGFIEASMEILESEPKVMQVWLIHPEVNNQHPITWHSKTGQFGKWDYGIMKAGNGVYSGIRFNPSLKRKADYDLIAPFSKWTTFDPAKAWKSEATIAKVYTNLGFKAAILSDIYIKHIGAGRHVGV